MPVRYQIITAIHSMAQLNFWWALSIMNLPRIQNVVINIGDWHLESKQTDRLLSQPLFNSCGTTNWQSQKYSQYRRLELPFSPLVYFISSTFAILTVFRGRLFFFFKFRREKQWWIKNGMNERYTRQRLTEMDGQTFEMPRQVPRTFLQRGKLYCSMLLIFMAKSGGERLRNCLLWKRSGGHTGRNVRGNIFIRAVC